MDQINEEKILTVLRFFLSLHGAYDIYEAIFYDEVTPDQLEKLLDLSKRRRGLK